MFRSSSAAACATRRRSRRRSPPGRSGSSSGPPRSATRRWPRRSPRPMASGSWPPSIRGPGRSPPEGWTESSDLGTTEVIAALTDRGVRRFVYTPVEVDGLMEGPDLDSLREAAEATDAELIYSGGIGSLDDLRALAELGLDNLGGVIVGRALYEQRFTVAEAQAVLDPYGSVPAWGGSSARSSSSRGSCTSSRPAGTSGSCRRTSRATASWSTQRRRGDRRRPGDDAPARPAGQGAPGASPR